MSASGWEDLFYRADAKSSMNIVYTIAGEGMGHASRSGVVIDHLLSQGHRVAIFSAGKQPLAYLREKFSSVAEVTGVHMVYRENKVQRLQTAARAIMNMTEFRKDIAIIKKSLSGFDPQIVITDFDFRGQVISTLYHIPIVSIDNIQHITKAKFHVEPEDFVNYEINYLVAKMIVPHADHFFICTFAHPELRRPQLASKISFVPPILRKKIFDTTPTRGEHIMVYQTSDSYTKLFTIISQVKEKFVVYNSPHEKCPANVVCKSFDENSFIADLASAKAVIVNGGFTVMTEALYFKKPILSIPIHNQYEQCLNGQLLQEMGLGMTVKRLTKVALNDFLTHHDQYEAQATKLTFGNRVLFDQLDRTMNELVNEDH